MAPIILTPRAARRNAENGKGEANAGGKGALHSFFVFNFFIAPSMILGICVALGALLALCEGWSFKNGFYFVAGTVTGVSSAKTSSSTGSELSLFGEVAEVIICILALTLTGGVIGLASIMSLATTLPEFLNVRDSVLNGLLTMLVFIPLLVLLFCALAGGLFSLSEGWDFRSGFEYLLQTLCGLTTPLTLRTPDGDRGMVISLVFAIAALGITSVIIGLVGHMAICEQTIEAIEKRIREMEAKAASACSCCLAPCFLFHFLQAWSSAEGSDNSSTGRRAASIDRPTDRANSKGSHASPPRVISASSPREVVRANVERRKSQSPRKESIVADSPTKGTTSPLNSPSSPEKAEWGISGLTRGKSGIGGGGGGDGNRGSKSRALKVRLQGGQAGARGADSPGRLESGQRTPVSSPGQRKSASSPRSPIKSPSMKNGSPRKSASSPRKPSSQSWSPRENGARL